MSDSRPAMPRAATPIGAVEPRVVLELLKPVTWFPPVWAFACGAVAAGGGRPFSWGSLAAGMMLAGPLVCGASQAINDWHDRHVDAINQPDRPIPSGRLPGRSGLAVAWAVSIASLLWALLLGPAVLVAAALALLAGWAYSAPPLRLKANGWLGPGLTALSYEGLSWITGSVVIGGAGVLARPALVAVALLYALGAHGIMTLNDFKAIEGDRRTGIASLPVTLGSAAAARIACAVMIVPQLAVAALLAARGLPWRAGVIVALVAGQGVLMRRLLRDPERWAPWYNGTGVVLYVAGMMVAAFAIRAAAAA